MGNSAPPPAAFDLIGSYARRRGTDVELVLTEPKIDSIDSPAVVELRKGKAVVEATGDLVEMAATPRLTVRAPRAQFTDGLWTLAVQRTDDNPHPLEARLLVQGQRPLVLLWGAETPQTVLPKTRPVPTPRRRAAAAGGRVLDRALTVLPEDTAEAVRSRVRTSARKLLG